MRDEGVLRFHLKLVWGSCNMLIRWTLKESGIARLLLFYFSILFYMETKKTYRKVGIGTFLNTRMDLRPSLLQSRCASLGLSVSPRLPPMYVTSFSAYTTGSNRTSSPWTLSTCSLPIAERTLKPSESIAASLDATTFCLRLSRQLTCLMSSSGSVISSRRSVKRGKMSGWVNEEVRVHEMRQKLVSDLWGPVRFDFHAQTTFAEWGK